MLWYSLKTIIAILVLSMLNGCSGVNVGTIDNVVDTQISSIAVIETSGRAGQIYSRALRRALYVQGQNTPAFTLTSSISISSSTSLSVRGVTSTFRKMAMVADFKLQKQDSDEVILTESVTADATLGTVSSLFSQDQSELHARDRMAKLLAQRVFQRLQLYFLKQSDL